MANHAPSRGTVYREVTQARDAIVSNNAVLVLSLAPWTTVIARQTEIMLTAPPAPSKCMATNTGARTITARIHIKKTVYPRN